MLDRNQEKKLLSFDKEEQAHYNKTRAETNDIQNKISKLERKAQNKWLALEDMSTEINQKRDDFIQNTMVINNMFEYAPKPVSIFVQAPMIEVSWDDRTKTRVAATHEPFDLEKGIAMAFLKKQVYGTQRNYHVMMDYIHDILIGEVPVIDDDMDVDFDSMSINELQVHAGLVVGFTIPARATKQEALDLMAQVIALKG